MTDGGACCVNVVPGKDRKISRRMIRFTGCSFVSVIVGGQGQVLVMVSGLVSRVINVV
jgi:hypothetical protein